MIKHLKFSVKMLRYSYGLLLNCVFGILFCLLGLLYMYIGAGKLLNHFFATVFYLGSLLVCLTGAFLVQPWMSFNSCGLVLSSPRRKTFLCAIPTLLLSVSCTLGFSVCLFICLVLHRFHPSETADIARAVYMLIFFVFSSMILFTVCYRFFTVFLVLTFLIHPILAFLGEGILLYLQQNNVGSAWFTLPVAAAVGYGILAADILITYGLALLLYRKPISKWSQGAPLRKYL